MIIDKNYNGLTMHLTNEYTISGDIVSNEDVEINLDKTLFIYGKLRVKGNLKSNVSIGAVGVYVSGDIRGCSICSLNKYINLCCDDDANIEVGGNIICERILCDKLIVNGNISVEGDVETDNVKAKNIDTGGMLQSYQMVKSNGNVSANYLNVYGINIDGSLTVKTNIDCYKNIDVGSYIDCGGKISTGTFYDAVEDDIYIDDQTHNIKCSELRSGKIVRGNLVLV